MQNFNPGTIQTSTMVPVSAEQYTDFTQTSGQQSYPDPNQDQSEYFWPPDPYQQNDAVTQSGDDNSWLYSNYSLDVNQQATGNYQTMVDQPLVSFPTPESTQDSGQYWNDYGLAQEVIPVQREDGEAEVRPSPQFITGTQGYGAGSPPSRHMGHQHQEAVSVNRTEEHPSRPSSRSSSSTVYGPRSKHSPATSSSSVDHRALKETRKVEHRNSDVVRYTPQRPEADPDKPWIRINRKTEGKTTRSGKNNQYNPAQSYTHYEKLPHPVGDWKGHKTEFTYEKWGELKQKVFSARQIREFIYDYPRVKGAKLKIWIQAGPTDCSRRYPTNTLSQCRFKDCPYRTAMKGKGTILHGHFRVAFDENWHKYREASDPYLCAAYFHLYCFERFLDLPAICRDADVEVDRRALSNEPRAKFAATLAGAPESGIAMDFIERCRDGTLREHPKFQDYPVHSEYRHGKAKPHKDTLTYQVNWMKHHSRPSSQHKQFEVRGLKNSNCSVHLGDLEVYLQGRVAQRQPKKSKQKKRKANEEAEASESEEEVQETRPKKKTRTTKQKTTRRSSGYGSEDEGSDASARSQSARTPTRRSPRTPREVNYGEVDNSDSLFVPEYHSTPQQGQVQQYSAYQTNTPRTQASHNQVLNYQMGPPQQENLVYGGDSHSHRSHLSGTNGFSTEPFPAFDDSNFHEAETEPASTEVLGANPPVDPQLLGDDLLLGELGPFGEHGMQNIQEDLDSYTHWCEHNNRDSADTNNFFLWLDHDAAYPNTGEIQQQIQPGLTRRKSSFPILPSPQLKRLILLYKRGLLSSPRTTRSLMQTRASSLRSSNRSPKSSGQHVRFTDPIEAPPSRPTSSWSTASRPTLRSGSGSKPRSPESPQRRHSARLTGKRNSFGSFYDRD